MKKATGFTLVEVLIVVAVVAVFSGHCGTKLFGRPDTLQNEPGPSGPTIHCRCLGGILLGYWSVSTHVRGWVRFPCL